MDELDSPDTARGDAARAARSLVRMRTAEADLGDVADDAELVISELATNAVLHGGGCRDVRAIVIDGGIRVEVYDGRPIPPVLGLASPDAMTGRGLRLVAGVASRWGVEPVDGGKVVWAEVTAETTPRDDLTEADLLAMWGEDDNWGAERPQRFHVVLGDVPTDLLLAAKSHVDNVVREFALAASGAQSGTTRAVVADLGELIDVVAHRFSEARDSIKRQALASAAAGRSHTRLELELDADAAQAAEEYLEALDAVDRYSRAARLLTLETPPQHKVFRRWYIGELVTQLRALVSGEQPPTGRTFESRILAEIDAVAASQRVAERAARLYSVAGALATAATEEAVAAAVLTEGVAALGASGGGVLLAAATDRLVVPGTVGYDDRVVARLREESRDAHLPAAVALRTGEPVWIESASERDRRFPELAELEPSTVAACAVPLEVQGRRLGAMRFSFETSRLFDEDEQRFVLTLAAQTAQALERAQLQQARLDASVRLQRSLLPPSIPAIPGVDIAAAYHPLGDGMEVGGDFYDLWRTGPNRWGLAIGDVSGTGPEAAGVTALLRYSLRALTLDGADVASTLVRLNRVLEQAASEAGRDEVFCTAVFGLVSTAAGAVHIALASGGHPYPVLRRADGRVDEVVLGGTLLGAFATPQVADASVVLRPGDSLVLFTDGVLEARDGGGEVFGVAGVRSVLEGCALDADPAATVAALEAAVVGHVGGELADDVAVLVLRAR